MRNGHEQGGMRRKRIALSWLGMPLLAGFGALVPAVTVLATANTWTSLAPMAGGPRGDLGAATGSDGRIYAIGGFAGVWLDRVEAYDTAANTWTTEAPMPGGGRSELAVATGPDGRIYAIGGFDSTSTPLDRVEAYDPTTNTWTTEAPLPGGGRFRLAAATGPDGRIYAIGGEDSSGPVATVEAYDTSTNTWTAEAPMPEGGRLDLAASTGPDGRIYAIGGFDGTNYLDRVEAYDTGTNTWTTVAPMAAGPRADLAAATGPDGRIYAIGGFDGTNYFARVEAFNATSDTWTSAQAMAAGARAFLAGATGPDGRIYAVGGFDGNNNLDRVEGYITIGGRLSASGATIRAVEGKPLSNAVVANFADADENTSASVYWASISWGDGTTSTGTVVAGGGGFAVEGSHTYVEEGSFTVTVQVGDLDAATTSATSTARVADAALTAAGLHLKQINDRVNGVVATFTDADPAAVAGDYNVSISWGDGTRSVGTVLLSGGGFAVWGTHHYLRDTEWAIVKVRIADAGGSTAMATTTARE
jgi:hypothetical protein